MTAPIINAAHQALLNSAEALNVEQVAKEAGILKASATKQLKELHGLGLIESEFRAGGKPHYFLSAPPAAGETVAPAAKPRDPALDPEKHQLTRAEREELSLLITIGDIRAAIGDKGQLSLGDLAPTIKTISDQRHAALDVVKVWEHNMRQAISTDEPITTAAAIRTLRVERDDLRSRLDAVTQQHLEDIGQLRAEIAQLHAVIDEQRAELEAARQTLKSNGQPVGYLVRATKRKMRFFTKQDVAHDASMSAVRAGAHRARVFALTLIGEAKRGAEWSAK